MWAVLFSLERVLTVKSIKHLLPQIGLSTSLHLLPQIGLSTSLHILFSWKFVGWGSENSFISMVSTVPEWTSSKFCVFLCLWAEPCHCRLGNAPLTFPMRFCSWIWTSWRDSIPRPKHSQVQGLNWSLICRSAAELTGDMQNVEFRVACKTQPGRSRIF